MKRKYILTGFLAVMLAASGCGKKEAPPPPPKEDTAPEGDPVQHKVLSFNLEGLTDRGEKKWDVTGQSAQAVSENEIRLDDIVAKTYGEEAEATITADKGVYDKSQNNVRLEENVRATIESSEPLTGDLTNFAGQATEGKKREAAGSGKAAKTNTVITCDGEVLFDYEKNLAYFNKNVKVVSDDGNIDADKITINLDPLTKKVKEIIAEGNVKIVQGENITYSESATYIEAERKIVLTGRPRLVIYQEGGLENQFLGK